MPFVSCSLLKLGLSLALLAVVSGTAVKSGYAGPPEGTAQSQFGPVVGSENLRGEQVLVSTVPAGSDPIHTVGKLFRTFGATGNLPSEFTGRAGKVFSLPTLLLRREEAGFYGSHTERTTVNVGGVEYERVFFHPLEYEEMRLKYPDAPADPVRWIATPTSSSRSFYAVDEKRTGKPFIVKTSLHQKLAGIERGISEDQAARAIYISHFYEQLAKETGGIIPGTSVAWNYFPEESAVGPKAFPNGNSILRSLPEDYATHGYIPWYGLIAERENGKPRWIDLLFEASGEKDKLEFAWESLVKPLLALHSLVQIDNGVVTELHQQNLLFKIDLKTNRLIGLSVRDMDGHRIDYAARKFLGLPVPEFNPAALDRFGFLDAFKRPMLGYEYLKDSSIKNTLGYFLSKKERRKLIERSNTYVLYRFNRRYASWVGTTSHFEDLPKAYRKLQAVALSPAERDLLETEAAFRDSEQSVVEHIQGIFINGYYKVKQSLEGPAGEICARFFRKVAR